MSTADYNGDDGRRTGCLIVEAKVGHVVAARGLIGRAIRKALGVRAWRAYPHLVVYHSRAEMNVDGHHCAERYTLNVTDEEFAKVCEVGNEMALAEGWTAFPIDGYHD